LDADAYFEEKVKVGIFTSRSHFCTYCLVGGLVGTLETMSKAI
jgi:hypothetical protein